jgi:hypothetical protein
MNYEEARSQIINGDILFFYADADGNPIHWFVHTLTRIVTKSNYVHVGVACWMHASEETDPRLFLIEAEGMGRRMVPLSLYEKKKFDIIPLPIDWKKVEADAIQRVGSVAYGFLNFISIGLHEMFKLKLKKFTGEVCSELAANLLVLGGYDKLSTSELSPGELCSELVKNGSPITMRVN